MEITFLDCETTGLDPEVHEPWEIALRRFALNERELVSLESKAMFVEHGLATASADALRLTDYYRRVPETSGHLLDRQDAARNVAHLTAGAHLAGAVPSFDAAFMNRLLRDNGYAPAWHYHLIDVEAVAVGATCWIGPWKSDDLSRKVGVEPEDFQRHSAMGDVNWAVAMFAAALDLEVVEDH